MAFGQQTATTALVQMIPANPRRTALLIKSVTSNLTTAYLKMDTAGGTATTATLMPIEPGSSFYISTVNGQIGSAAFQAPVEIISGTGGEDIRWIDF